jgi:hypothetical protein
MPQRGPRRGQRRGMGPLQRALLEGTQVANPQGSQRGPKTARIGTARMRARMRGEA